MKTKPFPVFVLAAGFITLGASAQVATPTPLAPAADIQVALQPSQLVYTPRLPSAVELTNVAGAQGLTIDKIVQTTSQMTVVYRNASGQTNTVAYVLLPSAGSPVAQTTTVVSAPATPAPQVVYAAAPTTQVVYYTPAPAPAPVYYYDPFYYPSYYSGWYAPVALSVGFGLGYHSGGHGGGSWHGGGHGRHGR